MCSSYTKPTLVAPYSVPHESNWVILWQSDFILRAPGITNFRPARSALKEGGPSKQETICLLVTEKALWVLPRQAVVQCGE